LTHLTELGIVRELTGKRRHRLYSYAQNFATLDRGTEPLPPLTHASAMALPRYWG